MTSALLPAMTAAGITLVAGLRAGSRYRAETRANLARLPLGSHVLDTGAGPTEYAVAGEGFPVLVAHGGAGGYDQGLLIAQSYLGEGLRAIAPSRFGYLRTPLAPDSSAPAQADAYAHLLDALGLERAAIVGVSAGGPSSLQFALRHPERCAALVLSAAVSRYLPARATGIYTSDFGYWFASTYLRRSALRSVGVTRELEASLGPAERLYLDRLFRSMSPFHLRLPGQLHDIEEWADEDRWAADYPLEKIIAPTLVIHAVDDTVVPFSHAEHTTQTIPGARLMRLASGGHFRLGHSERSRQEITRLLLAHSREADPPPSPLDG